ncbi:MAG: hypothetical protein WD276_07380 [Actinomycetota bacterium]
MPITRIEYLNNYGTGTVVRAAPRLWTRGRRSKGLAFEGQSVEFEGVSKFVTDEMSGGFVPIALRCGKPAPGDYESSSDAYHCPEKSGPRFGRRSLPYRFAESIGGELLGLIGIRDRSTSQTSDQDYFVSVEGIFHLSTSF